MILANYAKGKRVRRWHECCFVVGVRVCKDENRRFTMQQSMKLSLLLVGMVSLFLMVSGCHHSGVVVEEGPVYTPAPAESGPPPWAPAHGYRAKHRYYYYPASYVYFDIGRKLYFHFDGGQWRASVSLPAGIHIEAGDYVALDMDTDRPYTYHSDVAKRYPPGQAKKQDQTKGKGKWK
jgi:hypothetical protein